MPARAPRTPTLLALALALGLGLTGCGGDSDATADPPATASPSPSATSSPSPTSAPTEAPPGETARQFVYRWNELDKYMQNSGDTAAYRSITKRCRACQVTASKVEKYYADGGHVRTQGRQILSLHRIPSKDGFVVFRARLRLGVTTYRESRSGQVQRLDGGDRTYQIEVRDTQPWELTNYYVVVG